VPDPSDEILRVRRQVGQRIRGLREARGWSQERLAEAAGLSRHTMYRAELGTHATSIDTAASVAAALGVPLWWLFTDRRGPETTHSGGSGEAAGHGPD
jgi:transcriptional regulator with XRE-family HTH domain